jgi:hypothetical protein
MGTDSRSTTCSRRGSPLRSRAEGTEIVPDMDKDKDKDMDLALGVFSTSDAALAACS